MKRALTASIVLALAAPLALSALAPSSAQEEGAKAQKKERPDIYDEAADAEKQIAAALAKAKKNNRRVLIQWGANWCGWCHLLHELCAKNNDVRRELSYEYDVVLVDIGRWDKHLDVAERYQADFKSNGVPYLTVLDAEGKVLANQETGSLEVKQDGVQAHDPEKVLAFLKGHEARPWKARGRLAGALERAEKEEKQVFLTFGAPWCGWCHRLEDWMAQPDVAAILAKDFVTLKVDVDREIEGKAVMLDHRGTEEGGIPWFCFLDADGHSVATSGGPEDNLGCPYTDEEVAAFGKMLSGARRKMTAEDVAKLQKSLVDKREREKKK